MSNPVSDIFGSGIARFVSGLERVFDGLTKIFDPIVAVAKPNPATDETASNAKLQTAIDALTAAINHLAQNLVGTPITTGDGDAGESAITTPGTPAAPGAAGAGGTGVGGAAGAGGEAGEAEAGEAGAAGAAGLGGLAIAAGGAAIAISAAVSVVSSLVGQVEQFVKAFAPSDIYALDRAMANLSATIGAALEPIITTFTGVVQQVTGLIAPALEQLRPLVQAFASDLAGVVIPVVRLFASVFEAIVPLLKVFGAIQEVTNAIFEVLVGVIQVLVAETSAQFQILGAILSPVLDIFSGFAEVIKAVADEFQVVAAIISALGTTIATFISSLFGGLNLKSIFTQLADTIKNVTKQFVELIAYIALLFGQKGFVDELIKNLEGGDGKTAVSAQSSIKGFETIANDMTTAAFSAMGTGDDKKDDLHDIAEAVKKIEAGNIPQEIHDMAKAINDLVEFLKNPVTKTADAAAASVATHVPVVVPLASGGIGAATAAIAGLASLFK